MAVNLFAPTANPTASTTPTAPTGTNLFATQSQNQTSQQTTPASVSTQPTESFGQKYTDFANNLGTQVGGAFTSFIDGAHQFLGNLFQKSIFAQKDQGFTADLNNINQRILGNPSTPQESAVGAAVQKYVAQIHTNAQAINQANGVSDFAQKFGETAGSMAAQLPLFLAGGAAIESTGLPELLGSVSKAVPVIGKYLSPIVENTVKNIGAFSAANQPLATNHFKQFGQDLLNSGVFAIPGLIQNKLLELPAVSTVTYFMGRLQGQDKGTALASALIVGGMSAAGVLGDAKVSHDKANSIVEDKANEIIQNSNDTIKVVNAKEVLQEVTQPTPEELAQQFPPYEGDKIVQGKGEVKITQPPTEKQTPEPTSEVSTTPDLRTFDFHELEGQPQTDEENAKIHAQIIEHPDEPMTPGGETFNEAADRALSTIKNIIPKDEGNVGVTTHNSMYGLIKLWDEYGQPATLSRKFREEYTKQDNSNPTGDSYTIHTPNGDIELMRHGETTDNAKKVFRTSDAQLTEKGKEQAAALGEKLKGKGITKIYSSDLPRAIETSNIVMDTIKGNKEVPSTDVEKPVEKVISKAKERDIAAVKPVETDNEKITSQSVLTEDLKQILSAEDFKKYEEGNTHDKSVRVEQLQKAKEFINDNRKAAEDIMFNGENPPKGILHEDINYELYKQAKQDYDNKIIDIDEFRKYIDAYNDFGSRSAQELGARANKTTTDKIVADWVKQAENTIAKSNIEFKGRKVSDERVKRDTIKKEADKMEKTVKSKSKAEFKLADMNHIIDLLSDCG